jgi:hypothetical protein
MYFRLTGAIKDRFIWELQQYWRTHPRYRDDLPANIQGKYSTENERPQYGIIVKTGSGTKVDLSADNYIGIVNSYVYKAQVANYPGVAIEWVREDSIAIQNNGGRFPSPAGVYYIELTEDDTFYVDPLIDVYHEPVTMEDSSTGRLLNPAQPGSLRLFEMPAGFLLFEGVNYTLDPDGTIHLVQSLTNGRVLSADYRYPEASRGPYTFTPPCGINTVIPGCVMAFGRRNGKGDRMAIVVQDIRRPAALEYGGKWELTVDFEVITRDVESQQEIADYSVVYLWGILRPYLSTDGIEMTDISLGGESEEIYDENGDDYFFNSSFSVTVQTDWSLHVPLNVFLRQASPLTVAQARAAAGLSDDDIGAVQNNIRMLESLGLEMIQDPFFAGRTSTFETIR